jgi:hypothetical protein
MSCAMMRSIPPAEILRMSIQSPNAEAVARTLGISRRMLYDCWPSASLEEVRHALVQHVTVYKTPPTEERQVRLEGRTAAQAQMKAVQKEGSWEHTY